MKAQFKIESREFDEAIGALARITGFSQADIIKAECRAVLGKTMETTKKADKKKIVSKYTYKATQPTAGMGWKKDASVHPAIVKYIRIDGILYQVRKVKKRGVWATLKNGKSKYYPNRINPIFKKMIRALSDQKKYALSQLGQSKATFIYMAEKLKIKDTTAEKSKFGGVRVPAYVNQLTSKLSTKLRSLIKTHESTKGNNFGVTMVHNGRVANSTLASGGAGGRSAFFKAFYGRQAYYEKNIDKGVFKSMKKILQKYPELRVLDK